MLHWCSDLLCLISILCVLPVCRHVGGLHGWRFSFNEEILDPSLYQRLGTFIPGLHANFKSLGENLYNLQKTNKSEENPEKNV